MPDRLCTHFVLTLTLRQTGRLNPPRDWNGLLALTGRHLVWPVPVLARLRQFLRTRCRANPAWRGHEALSDAAFIARHGVWAGPYEEGTLFFYLDEFVKDSAKDLMAVLGATREWLARQLKTESNLVQKNIDALAGLLQLNPAERALLLYGTLARHQRELRGLLVEFEVGNAHEAHSLIAEVAGVQADDVAEALRAGSRLERIGMVENLLSEHSITDLDEAALRRFTFKIRFHAPRAEQRERMFVAEALAGGADALNAEQRQRLAALDALVPGDFAAVQRQAGILGAALAPDEFLSQLEGEHRVKPEVRQRRGIGFLGGA